MDGYFIEGGRCKLCGENCLQCTGLGKCMKCGYGYILVNGLCQSKEAMKCNKVDDRTICYECDPSYGFDNNGDCKVNSNTLCVVQKEGSCHQCSTIMEEPYQCAEKTTEDVEGLKQAIDDSSNSGNNNDDEDDDDDDNENDDKVENKAYPYKQSCNMFSTVGCLRCNPGYYVDGMECKKCNPECATCTDGNSCSTCAKGDETYIDGKCTKIEDISANCRQLLPNGVGCAFCLDGYYRNSTECMQCPEGCSTCLDNTLCFGCNDNYYMTAYMSVCKHQDALGEMCLNKTKQGCQECAEGYYLESNECHLCKEGCLTCNNGLKCTACVEGFVKDVDLESFICRNITEVEFCLTAVEGKCTQCVDEYTPSEDGTKCNPPSNIETIAGSIGGGLALALLVIIGLVIVIIYLIEKKRQFDKYRNITIFDMRKCNMDFDYRINESLYANKMEMTFDEGQAKFIPVGEETKDIICIGNDNNDYMKIQFTTKEDTDRYEIRTNPQIIILKRYEAVEFEVFIKPLCTTSIEDSIRLVTVNMKKGVETFNEVKISFTTQLSTRLDPDELIEDRKLGEGTFGTVYEGTFRGQKVAIKKMKNLENEEDQQKLIAEFDKEVKMLDKFRSIYVINFVGAVYLVKKIAIVTELAPYGSIQDMIQNSQDNPLKKSMRIKFCFDCTKGLQYLHLNGILHRDIKPDNFLVTNLDESGVVNADFGSARNVNMLMTNMTFTKGIGSPKYMAPEILNREHYKDQADIFSLAITMYEIFSWADAYPQDAFPFPWKIAEFVSSGNRLRRVDDFTDEEWEVVEKCWAQDPKARPRIDFVVAILKAMNRIVKKTNYIPETKPEQPKFEAENDDEYEEEDYEEGDDEYEEGEEYEEEEEAKEEEEYEYEEESSSSMKSSEEE